MTQQEKLIKHKVGLLELGRQLDNVSKACRVLGFTRDTFYRWKELYEQGGEEALKELSRSKPNLKNRVPEEIETAVLSFALEQPAYGQVRVSNELAKQGIKISGQGVRGIWLRHSLQTMKLRLAALERKMAEENLILTESQLQALERAQQ